MTMLSFLSHFSVLTNCAMMYFTHQKLSHYFMGYSPLPDVEDPDTESYGGVDEDLSWEAVEFFMLVVVTEHVIILIKQIIHS